MAPRERRHPGRHRQRPAARRSGQADAFFGERGPRYAPRPGGRPDTLRGGLTRDVWLGGSAPLLSPSRTTSSQPLVRDTIAAGDGASSPSRGPAAAPATGSISPPSMPTPGSPATQAFVLGASASATSPGRGGRQHHRPRLLLHGRRLFRVRAAAPRTARSPRGPTERRISLCWRPGRGSICRGPRACWRFHS